MADKEPVKKSDQAEAALRAAAKILAPFKDEIAKEDLDVIVVKADEAADDKAPAKKKTSKKDPKQVADDEGDNMDEKDQATKKDKKAAVEKKDGELDLSGVPEDMRPQLESIFKSNQELVAKSQRLETELNAERKTRREKEFVAKCDGFKHYAGDKHELALQLMELSDANPKLYDNVVKQLEAVEIEKAAAAGTIFRELGSSAPGTAGTSFEAIEKAAEGYVAKSGDKVTKEGAVEKFLATEQGKAMYTAYKASRKDGV